MGILRCVGNAVSFLDVLSAVPPFLSRARKSKPAERRDRSQSNLTLAIPFSRTEAFKNSYFVRICRLWNDLPLAIRESNNLVTFRNRLLQFYKD